MAKVQLCNITVMDNPSPFLNPFQFEITFECIEELKEGKCKTTGFFPCSGSEYLDKLSSMFIRLLSRKLFRNTST